MKHFFSFLALALMASAATARELVVTLKDGTRQAFHLSASEHVVMLQAEDGFTLNGLSYKTEDVAELRIFKNVPEDATDITAVAEPKAEADRVLPSTTLVDDG